MASSLGCLLEFGNPNYEATASPPDTPLSSSPPPSVAFIMRQLARRANRVFEPDSLDTAGKIAEYDAARKLLSPRQSSAPSPAGRLRAHAWEHKGMNSVELGLRCRRATKAQRPGFFVTSWLRPTGRSRAATWPLASGLANASLPDTRRKWGTMDKWDYRRFWRRSGRYGSFP